MNNILKRTVSSVLAFTVALSSVQLYGTTASAAASGVKGDANADGVVTEADLDVYESFLLGNAEIAEDILEDMDIDYGNTYQYVEVNGNDYAAVRNYLEGCTQTIEPSGHIDYKNDGGILHTTLYAGYYSSNAVYIAETDSLTNSITEHEITEIIWDGGKPDWVTEVEREGKPYIEGTPDETDVGTYSMLIVGKDLSGKYHAIANDVEVCLPDYKVTTEGGNVSYESGVCVLFGPGTYNITSSVTDVSDMIMIADIGQSGKYIINLNGMNVNYGDALSPGCFIQTMSLESGVPTVDIDIVLSGSNVIKNADAYLYTEGQVNIYGDDDDTLSLLGNSSIYARAIKVNGGKVTVKSNYYQAMEAEQLTMMGGSLDLSFSPIEGQQWDTSNTTLSGVGLICDEVIIRKGDLLLNGNDGAFKGVNSTPKLYISPLYCDIEVEVSDDGTTYTAIEGSPFSDPDNSPSAYTGVIEAGAPDNSVDISDHVADKDFLKIVTGHTYSYKVTIDAGEHGSVTYEDDTASQKSFWVPGGEKLPEGITLTADEGWEIDSIKASINGGSATNVTDISEIVIGGDTVINVTTKDVKAPVINGVTDGSNYCGTITFTVTDDSDVSVTINEEVAQPDENGVYTIVGNTSSYEIIATDAFGNETTYVITVYTTHPSTSDHQDNGDGTHTGVCDYCHEDVVEEHNFSGWDSVDETVHENVCEDCGYTETNGHIMGDWESDNGDTHSRECGICHYLENTGHDFGEWTDNHESGKHERECEDCGHTETDDHNFDDWTPHIETNTHRTKCEDCGLLIAEPHSLGECEEYNDLQHITNCEDCAFFVLADHTYGEWTDNPETEKCERECTACGRTEEAEHVFGDWVYNRESDKHERECENCGHKEEADHDFGEWTDNHESGKHERICLDCGYIDEAAHNFSEWTDNHESGKHERECEDCGHTETDDHNFDDWTPHIETNTHRTKCEDCGLLIAEPHSLGECEEYNDLQHITNCEDCAFFVLADHTYGEWTDNPETEKCERECTACGRTEEAEHVFGEWTDNPDTGKHERVCVTCGHTEEAEHDFNEWANNPDTGKCERECETCEHVEEADHVFSEWTDDHETNKHRGECEVCGYIEEADHIFSEWADNHESGKCERECETCGHVEEADHIFGEWADNHESGKCERECETCGHTEEADHIFSEWADNHESGKCERECETCGHTEEADHIFGEWADNHESGKCERECETCGHTEEADHIFGEWFENDKTQHKQECKVCGHYVLENHKFDNAENIGDGQHKLTCSVCGIEKIEACNGVWETVKEATCTEEGKEEMICNLCGEKHTKIIEMLPHEFINGRCSSCYFVDPAIGDSSENPPTGVTLGAGLVTLIPVSALIFFARPKTKKKRK